MINNKNKAIKNIFSSKFFHNNIFIQLSVKVNDENHFQLTNYAETIHLMSFEALRHACYVNELHLMHFFLNKHPKTQKLRHEDDIHTTF